MERDPVCGMAVDPEKAKATAQHAGKSFYFCCSGCAAKFAADPAKYLAAPAPAPMHAAGHMPAQLVTLGGIAPASAAPPVKSSLSKGDVYICPMDPEVRQGHPGPCPKCGMSLEPAIPAGLAARTEYTCPMHPDIVRANPGSCPKCGMALEPRTAVVADEENPELASMTLRFWSSVALTIPVLILGMSDRIPGQPLQRLFSMRFLGWMELLLATPVVIWAAWPFFERGWASLANHSLNMFTLIALGTGTAYVYSLVAVLLPGIFPASFRDMNGAVPVYFEAAAAITALVLLGQVLELRARSRTSHAIRTLLQLSPRTER